MSGSADLAIALSVRMGTLEAGLRKATDRLREVDRSTRQAQTGLAGLGGMADRVGQSFSRLSTALRIGAIVAGATTLANIAGRVINQVSAMADAAAALGVSVTDMQTVTRAYEASGGGADQAQQAMSRLATTIGEANAGSKEAQQAFVQMGVAFRNIDGTSRSTSEVMQDLFERIRDARSETDAMSIAAQAFGQRGARFAVNAAREMSEGFDAFRRTVSGSGLVLGAETVAAVKGVGDAWTRLTTTLSNLWAEMVAGLAPAIVPVLDFIQARIANLIAALRGLFGFLGDVGRAVGLIEATPFQAAQADLAREQRAFGQAIENRQRWLDQMQQAESSGRLMSEYAADRAEQLARLDRAVADRLAARDAAQRRLAELTPTEPTIPASPAAPRVDAGGGRGGGGGGGRTEEWVRQREALLSLVEPWRSVQAQMQTAEALFQARRIDADQLASIMGVLSDRMKQLQQSAEKAKGPVEGFWSSFSSAFGGKGGQQSFDQQVGAGIGQEVSSAFGDLFNLMDKIASKSITAGEAIKQFAGSLLQSLARVVAQAAAMRMVSALIGSIFGGGASTAGLSKPAALFGGAKMAGGSVAGGYTYLVGERGPELFTAPGAGRIVPNGEIGGGGMQVVVNNNAPGVVVRQQQIDERTVMLAVNLAREQVAADYAESHRTGHGSYAEPLGRHWNARRRL